MFQSLKRTATIAVVAIAATASLAGTPLSPVADAAAATSIQGFVTLDGGRVAGATINVYRAPAQGGTWVNTGVRATTNASGGYYVGGLSNWYQYIVEAYVAKIYCNPLGFWDAYRGYSIAFYAQGGARGANIVIGHVARASCF